MAAGEPAAVAWNCNAIRQTQLVSYCLKRVMRCSGVETAGVGTRVGEKQGGTVYGEKDGLAVEQ